MNQQQLGKVDQFLKMHAPVAPAAPAGAAEQIFQSIGAGHRVDVVPANSGLIATLSLAAALALGVFVSVSTETDRRDSVTASEVLVDAVLDMEAEEDSEEIYGDWTLLASTVSAQ